MNYKGRKVAGAQNSFTFLPCVCLQCVFSSSKVRKPPFLSLECHGFVSGDLVIIAPDNFLYLLAAAAEPIATSAHLPTRVSLFL